MALLQVERWPHSRMRYKNGEVFDVGCNVENYQSPSKPICQNKQEIQDYRKGGEDDLPDVRIFPMQSFWKCGVNRTTWVKDHHITKFILYNPSVETKVMPRVLRRRRGPPEAASGIPLVRSRIHHRQQARHQGLQKSSVKTKGIPGLSGRRRVPSSGWGSQ